MVKKKQTDRGFGIWRIPFHDYQFTAERVFEIQESSSAEEVKLWVGPTEVYVDLSGRGSGEMTLMERAHLGVEEVRKIRDALTEWLEENE